MLGTLLADLPAISLLKIDPPGFEHELFAMCDGLYVNTALLPDFAPRDFV